MGGNKNAGLGEVIHNIIQDIGVPLGVMDFDRGQAEWEKNFLAKLQKEHKQIVEIPAQPNS